VRVTGPFGIEGEAPNPHGAGAGGQAGRLVPAAPPGDRGARRHHVLEPAGAARDDLVGAPQARDGEPVAIRLLPAEPAVGSAPRSEHGRARIVQVDAGRDADQALAPGGLGQQRFQRTERFGRLDHATSIGRVVSG